ncbi:MAG: cytochrome c [Herminiimonas sp.]|jgi:cytochrome c6|nr:cytochrome c [Herminiimonas sp.]
MKLITKRAAAAAAWCVLAGLASGSAQAQAAMEEGKKLFNQTAVPACAVCHTLKHAGAAGEIGPSLDELKPDAARVEKAMRTGIGQMPAFTNLSDAQIRQIAAYVAAATGAAK